MPIASRDSLFKSLNESSSSSSSGNFFAASMNTLSEIFEHFEIRMRRRLLVLCNLKDEIVDKKIYEKIKYIILYLLFLYQFIIFRNKNKP